MECMGDNWDCIEREVVDVFRNGKFELLALTEKNLKGKRFQGMG